MGSLDLKDYAIRPAKVEEANDLTFLADRSKSYWPYDEEYLKLCRAVTRITAEDITQWPVLVATNRDKIVGFAALAEVRGENMLDHLWIDPIFIGRGIGRKLFFEIVERAKNLGWKEFLIISDPYAEKFYSKMGAQRIGETESKVQKGLFLPLMKFSFLSEFVGI